MEDVLVGLIALALGLAVCFMGLRLWFVMLPIWGFVAGFSLGAIAVTSLFGDGFLSTVTGWVVGFFVGLLAASISYLWWYVGALIAASSVGAMAGSGLFIAIGVEANWILFAVGLVGAVVFALVAFVTALPVWVVVINTAIAGAAGAVLGVMLIFDQVELDALSREVIRDSWFWLLVALALAVFGVVTQMDAIRRISLPEARLARAA